jgi:putative aldouronate transport system permease protein
MKIKRSPGDILFDIVNYIFLTVLALSCLYPILHVLFASFSDAGRLVQHRGPLFAPLGFSIEGYLIVFQNPNIIQGYLNTIFYVAVGTLLNVFLTSMGGFVLSRRNFLWRREVMLFFTFTMFFSGGIIPAYLNIRNIGLFNSRWAVILPVAVSTYNLIIMRTAMSAVPPSLEESAMLDGASEFRVYWNIMLPLTTATLAVITLMYAVSHWNAWFNASIYLRERSKYPLQIVLREILLFNDNRDSATAASNADDTFLARELVKYCTIIVATVPVLCLYPFIQKYFVKGVMVGSVKE